jgi:hypothetical protein
MILTIALPDCRHFEKKPQGRFQTKNTFFAATAVRNDPESRPPVNFASNILCLKKT